MRLEIDSMIKYFIRIAPAVLFACFVLGLAGCMVGPKYHRPDAAVPQGFKEAAPAGWKQAEPKEGIARGKWWEVYNDPQLNALEEQVSISNQNVLFALAQYREARDQVRIARSGYFPTISASPSVTNSRSSANLSTRNLVNFISGSRSDYNLPVDVSYQADVWGSIRRSVTANTDTAQASAANLENARLSFQAQLAEFYFELQGADSNEELLANTVKIYEEYLKLTQARYNVGVASGADVAQAETQLTTTQAQLIDVGVQRSQFEHAIAILVGKPPAQLSIAGAGLKQATPQIPLTVPSALLERRPDIAIAERQVAAANEQIGIARAALFPSLILNASGGFESSSITNWLTWPSRFWSVGPQLAQTLFDGGKRRAQIDLQEAAYDATVANYRQTVLVTFQQVEDNLAALRILEAETKVADEAVQAAQRSLDISTAQYKAGTSNYLQVITSQAAALQSQRTVIDILTRRMTASVLLIEALGGGWDTSMLPTSAELRTKGK